MSLRRDMLQLGQSYTDGMFCQLDTDPQHRPILTRPVTRASDPSPPLTTKDYQEFESITQVTPPPPEDHRKWRPQPKVDLSHITSEQWAELSDHRISRLTGSTQLAVTKWRRGYNCPRFSGSTASFTRKYDYDRITWHQWQTLTNKQVAALLGCQAQIVRRHRVSHRLPIVRDYSRNKVPWHLITPHQWETLTVKEIAAIVGCSYTRAYIYRRTKLP